MPLMWVSEFRGNRYSLLLLVRLQQEMRAMQLIAVKYLSF